jgi:creatinine amidohydrolase
VTDAGAPKVWLSDLTHEEVAARLDGPRVAVLPMAATEQHGRHLPLDVDTRLTSAVCEGAAREVAGEIGVVIAPTLLFGISEHHMRFPGSLTLRPETFIAAAYDVGTSLIRHGFDRLVLVNGHGGNVGAMAVIAWKLKLEGGASEVVYVSHWTLGSRRWAELREAGPGGAAHACEFETSLYLHLAPERVQMEKAERYMPPPAVEGSPLDLFVPGPYASPLGYDFSPTGVLGDPTLATAEKGRQAYEATVAELARLLREVAHGATASALDALWDVDVSQDDLIPTPPAWSGDEG